MSAILPESYSFIWHPKVRMKTFFVVMAASGARRDSGLLPNLGNRIERPGLRFLLVRRPRLLRALGVGEDPHVLHPAERIEHVVDDGLLTHQRAGHHQQVVEAANA